MKPFIWRVSLGALFLCLSTASAGGHGETDPEPVAAPQAPLQPLPDAEADRILRDSCQRCHDNARVALVNSGQRVLPAIRRSARFNLEALNLIMNRSSRGRLLRAIETGGMPFADDFVINRERIHRDRFLESETGRRLLLWLRQRE